MVAFTAPGQVAPGSAYPLVPGAGPGPEPTPEPVGGRYDVILHGQGYMIDLETYRSRQKTEFAPKTREGDTGYGDLLGSSAWARHDWAGGFGYPDFDPAHPDRFADGTALDISYGDMRAGRQFGASATTSQALTAFAPYGGALYGVNGTTTLYVTTTGTSWSGMGAVLAAGGISIWPAFTHLCVGGSDAGGTVSTYDGTTWNSAALVTAGTSAGGITVGLAYRFDSVAGGQAYFLAGAANCRPTGALTTAAAPGVSTLINAVIQLGGTPLAATALVAIPFAQIDALVYVGDRIYLAASNGQSGPTTMGALFLIDAVGPSWSLSTAAIAPLVALRDNAIASFGTYQGKLLAGSMTNGIVWEVGASGLTELFRVPELARLGSPPVYLYPIRSLVTDDERLIVPIRDAAGGCLYQFDGTGWSRLTTAVGFAPTGPPYQVTPFAGALHLGTFHGVARAPTGPATQTTLITSWFDAGLPGLDKAPTTATITHTPLTAGQAIIVEYQFDDDPTWHVLGGSNTVGAAEVTLTFPAGITADRGRVRYTLLGSSSASVLKIKSTVVAFQLLPDVKRQWEFQTVLAGVPGKQLMLYDETVEPKTGAELSDTLWATRTLKTQLTFIDIDQAEYTVWFADLSEEIDRGRPRAELATRGAVRLEEA